MGDKSEEIKAGAGGSVKSFHVSPIPKERWGGAQSSVWNDNAGQSRDVDQRRVRM